MSTVIGWDIGGVNTKVARVDGGAVTRAHTQPFEVQHHHPELSALLARLATALGIDTMVAHGVTMTAELSQLFRSKSEGVRSILDAVTGAFPASPIHVFAVDGTFLSVEQACAEPYRVAASNWAATARMVGRIHPDAILIDVGTTTTDVTPIVGGKVVARGTTDPDRLACSELVYIGALRTPVEALASEVPYRGNWAGTSAEGFATLGDIHLWRGDITPDDYTVPTADGRPPTRQYTRERVARVICADRGQVTDEDVSAIVEHVAEQALTRIASALARVLDQHPHVRLAVTTGLGEVLATRAARRMGLQVVSLSTQLGTAVARLAPAAAVALLLEESLALGRDA